MISNGSDLIMISNGSDLIMISNGSDFIMISNGSDFIMISNGLSGSMLCGILHQIFGLYHNSQDHMNVHVKQLHYVHVFLNKSKTCVKRPPSKSSKIGFQDQLSLNAGQMYCRMFQREHSAILLTFIKLPFVIKIFILSFF